MTYYDEKNYAAALPEFDALLGPLSPALEGRQSLAHGVSRGVAKDPVESSPGRGVRALARAAPGVRLLRPAGAWARRRLFPTAGAVGFILTPLRGYRASPEALRRFALVVRYVFPDGKTARVFFEVYDPGFQDVYKKHAELRKHLAELP
jgi:hypothetical protein